MSDTQTYRVAVDAWIDGGFRAAHGTIMMVSAAAKYWLLAGTIEEIEAPTPTPETADAKPLRKVRE